MKREADPSMMMEGSTDSSFIPPLYFDVLAASDSCESSGPLCIVAPKCELYTTLEEEHVKHSWQESFSVTHVTCEDSRDGFSCSSWGLSSIYEEVAGIFEAEGEMRLAGHHGNPQKKSQQRSSTSMAPKSSVSPGTPNHRSISPGRQNERSVSQVRLNQRSISPGRPNERSSSQVRLNQRSTSPGRLNERSVSPGRLNQRSTSPGRLNERNGSQVRLNQRSTSPGRLNERSVSPGRLNQRSSSPGRPNERSGSQVRLNQRSTSPGRLNERSVSPGRLNQRSTSPGRLNERSVSPGRLNQRSTSPGRLNERSGSQVRLNQRSISPGRLNERSVSPGRLNQRSTSPGRLNERSGSQVRLNQRSTSPGRPSQRSTSPMRPNQRSSSPERPHVRRSVSPIRSTSAVTQKRSASPVRPMQRSTSPERDHYNGSSPLKSQQKSTSQLKSQQWIGTPLLPQQRNASVNSTSPLGSRQRSTTPTRTYQRSTSPITSQHYRSSTNTLHQRSTSPVRPLQRNKSPERNMPISEQRSTFYAGQALSSSRRSSISNTVKKEMYSAKQSYTHTVQNPPNLGVSRRLTSSTSSLDSEGGSRGSSNRVPYTTLADIPPAKRLGHAFKKSKDLKNQTRSPGRAEVDRIFGQDRRTAEVLEAFQALEAGLIERLPDKNPSLQRRLTRRQSTPCLYPEESVLMRQELRSRRASLHPTPRTDRDYYNTPGRSSRDPSPHRTGSQGRQLSPEPEWMNRDKLLRPTGKQDKKEDNNEIPWTKREKLLKPVESVGSKPTEHPYNWQSFRSSSSEGWNKEVESVGSKQTEHPYNWQSFRSSSSEGWNKEHQGVKESFAESLGRNSLGSQHQYTRRTSVAQKEELQYKSSNTNGSQNQKTQPGYRLSAESLPVQDPVYNNITGSQYSYCYSSKNDSDGLKYKPAGPLSGHTPESQPKQYSGSYLSTECSQYKTQTEEEILSHTHVPQENIHLQTASSQESVYRNSHRPYTGKAISQTSDIAYTGYLRPQTPPVETSRKNSLEDYRQPSEFVKSSVGGQTSHADPTYGVFKGTQKPQTSELHSKEHNSTLQNNALSGSDRSVLKHSNGPVHSESQKWQVQQEATGCHLSEGQSGLWQVVKHTEFHHDHDLYLNTSVKNGKPDLLNFKKGWMSLLDANGEWKKHWFVLTDSSLKYYRDSNAEEADELDGEIDLRTCTNVPEFAVQRNYGFQIHTREGVFTLSAMTSGIRRNWIEALRKNVHPVSIPDVTKLSESNKENTFVPPRNTTNRPEELRLGSEVKHRKVELPGTRHSSFDYVELSPLSPGEERDQRLEERRRWFEAPPMGETHTTRRVAPVLTEEQKQRANEDIEAKWKELERLPLRDSKQTLTCLFGGGRNKLGDNTGAQEKEIQSLKKQLEKAKKELESQKSGKEGAVPTGYISQEACERSLSQMEASHKQLMSELQRHHEWELQRLRQEKEQLLAEEAAATASVIESIRNAHKVDLQREVEKARSFQHGGFASQDLLRRQNQSEMESLRRELQALSERYSQKCLEINALNQAGEDREKELQRCQTEGQELLRQNQELNKRLSEEIGKLRSLTAGNGPGDGTRQGEKNNTELEVLLRVKDNELQYLQKEISCLREDLENVQKDKRYASEKYKDIYMELSNIKIRSEREIDQLKEHLRLAMAALREEAALRNSVGE